MTIGLRCDEVCRQLLGRVVARVSRFGTWKPTAAVFLLVIRLLLPVIAGAQVKVVRRVLVLNELGPASPAINLIDGEIRDRLERSPYQIELYTESLETTLFPDPATQQELLESYVHKYRDRTPDVIIAVGPSPLHFLAQSHETFFSKAPVVFCVSTQGMVGSPELDSSFTGVWEMPDFTKTLEVALKLLPNTRHIVVVGGVAAYDRANEAILRDGLRGYEARFDITYLTDLDMPTLLEHLKRLPRNSIILQAGISEDAAGTRFIIATQSNPLVARNANAPVFPAADMADVDVGQGAIGGYLVSFFKEGQIVADDAARILGGAKPKDIPIVRGANVYMFDWRALKRWGLNEKNLPAGSIVLNRQPSFWDLYSRYVVAGILIFAAQALIITGLLWQRSRRRKAEVQLRDSQSRLEGIVESAMDAVISIDEGQRIVVFNEAAEKVFGCSARDAIGSPIDRFIPERFREAHREHVRHFGDTGITTRSGGALSALWALHANGKEFPIEASISQTRVGDRKLFTVIVRDITERKRAEEALSSIGRRLIEAHEEERARIARELHDDINQRIALLSVSLDGLEQDLPASDDQMSRRVHEALEHVSELGDDVQALSHRLHSSKLEYLGLESAAAGFCREFSAQKNVEIDFHAESVPKDLPKEISICLFRVLQEALQNALKHSGSRHFEVSLRNGTNAIELTVHDSGVGFDPKEAINRHGLGPHEHDGTIETSRWAVRS